MTRKIKKKILCLFFFALVFLFSFQVAEVAVDLASNPRGRRSSLMTKPLVYFTF